MNFFETLFEGIDLEVGNINGNETFEMSEDDFEQAIEVMEANKFLAQTRLDALNVEKACLEAEISDINGFFLGEGLSDIKDKALELWEKFKEWVEGILAKVKVFFAKFAMSRKQMTVLDRQMAQISSEKKAEALRNLGYHEINVTANRTAMVAIIRVATAASSIDTLTRQNVDSLKQIASTISTEADALATSVKTLIDGDNYSGETLQSLHSGAVKPIGALVKSLETILKTAQKAQRKHDRLDRGTDPGLDSEAVTQMKGIINAANKVYATTIKYFFHEVKINKNIIAYAGKEARLSTSDKKDMNKIKGRVKF